MKDSGKNKKQKKFRKPRQKTITQEEFLEELVFKLWKKKKN